MKDTKKQTKREKIEFKGIECLTRFGTPIFILSRSVDFDTEGWCYCARPAAIKTVYPIDYRWFKFGDMRFPIKANLDEIIKRIQALPVRDRR